MLGIGGVILLLQSLGLPYIYFGKVLTGSSDFTLKSLLPVNWQQRFYDEMAAASWQVYW